LLSKAEVLSHNEHWELSARFEGAIRSGHSPDGGIFSIADYFDALWGIAQFLIREDSLDASLKLGRNSITIENFPIAQRMGILASASDLLKDQAEVFVRNALAKGLSAQNFSGRHHQFPNWLNEKIAERLSKRIRSITPAHVRAAMDARASRSLAISKRSIRLALGVSESKHIDAVLSQRRIATQSELQLLMEKFEISIANSPPSRSAREAAIRDYLIFLVSVLEKEKLESVCAATASTIQVILASRAPGAGLVKHIVDRASELNDFYAHQTRPRFSAGKHNLVWFLSRFGVPVMAHSVRARISRLMDSGFDPQLWKSGDVFLESLAS
jgi:hypothetical protein